MVSGTYVDDSSVLRNRKIGYFEMNGILPYIWEIRGLELDVVITLDCS